MAHARKSFVDLGRWDPLLDIQMEGRLLGRPLSGELEFWRAAPDTALYWGAEEFDFRLLTAPVEEGEAYDDPAVTGLLWASAACV